MLSKRMIACFDVCPTLSVTLLSGRPRQVCMPIHYTSVACAPMISLRRDDLDNRDPIAALTVDKARSACQTQRTVGTQGSW